MFGMDWQIGVSNGKFTRLRERGAQKFEKVAGNLKMTKKKVIYFLATPCVYFVILLSPSLQLPRN